MYRLLNSKLLIIGIIVLIAIIFRIIPHPANFAPIGALALMGGVMLSRKHAVWLPLTAMAISDLIIGLHPLILWTWGSFALIAIMSSTFLANRNIGPGKIFTGAISSGLLFFVITNFGVWLQSGLYAHTTSGLIQCYYNALPFLRNTLLGDVFFSTSFFALYLVTKDLKILNRFAKNTSS
jgi:hypothetical protein